jgi:hypothetical protein
MDAPFGLICCALEQASFPAEEFEMTPDGVVIHRREGYHTTLGANLKRRRVAPAKAPAEPVTQDNKAWIWSAGAGLGLTLLLAPGSSRLWHQIRRPFAEMLIPGDERRGHARLP